MPAADPSHGGAARLETVLAGYPAVLFDLDGVLVDSNEMKVDCMRTALTGLPVELVEAFLGEFRRSFGRSRRAHFTALYADYLGSPGDFEEFYDRYAGAYTRLLGDRYGSAPACAHAVDLVHRLAGAGHRLHVVTGTLSGEAEKVLTGLGLRSAFDQVLGGERPKAERVSAVLAGARMRPGQAVLLGDARNDLLAAHHNSVAFVFVARYSFLPVEQVLAGPESRGARWAHDLDPAGPVRLPPPSHTTEN